MAKKIYLSPSNQDGNTYAVGNTNEMVQCNKIAEAAKKALERNGFSVKKAPEGQAMKTSVAQSNEWGADLHIPIHTNAFNGSYTGGTMVMIYNSAAENTKAATTILKAVAPITPGDDYSIQTRPELYELSATTAVAVYLESEFHDTAEGAQWIISNTVKLGEAIAKGVCNYYDVYYNNGSGSEVTDKLYRVRKSWPDAASQIGAFSVYENAVKMADANKGYYVFDPDGKLVYTPGGEKKLTLKAVPLYISATAAKKSSDVTGNYYLWSGEEVNGRVKITDSVKNIGKQGQVTGWIDKKYAV